MGWGTGIKRHREARGLTQGALSELLNVDQSTVSRWERNAAEPSLYIKRKLQFQFSEFDRDDPTIVALIEKISRSDAPLILTEPGSFKNDIVSPAAVWFYGLVGAGANRYDWELSEKTPQQTRFFGKATNNLKMFQDRSILCATISLEMRLPTGRITFISSCMVPVWGRSGVPRFLLRGITQSDCDGCEGKIIIQRSLGADEEFILPN